MAIDSVNDNLPTDETPIVEIPVIEMETKDVLNSNEEVIGTLTLPNTTTEEEWIQKLAEYINSYTPSPTEIAKAQIKQATEFGKELLLDFGAYLLVEETSLQDIQIISITLQNFQLFMLTGSLFSALAELQNISTNEVFTDVHKNWLLDKFNRFLGV